MPVSATARMNSGFSMSVEWTLNASAPSSAARSNEARSKASTSSVSPEARAAFSSLRHSLVPSSIVSKSFRPGWRRTTSCSERKSWNLIPSAPILNEASSIFRAVSMEPP